MSYELRWPGNLSLWDLNRLVRMRLQTGSVESEVAKLNVRGEKISVGEANALVDSVLALERRLGFYPLDAGMYPERRTDNGELPSAVLATQMTHYVDCNDPRAVVAFAEGEDFEEMGDRERRAAIAQRRRRVAAVAVCKEEGCQEVVHITYAVAAQAIRNNDLIRKGLAYDPSTLCKKHREMRDAKMGARKSDRNGNGGHKPCQPSKAQALAYERAKAARAAREA